jgi:hypothetical protein
MYSRASSRRSSRIAFRLPEALYKYAGLIIGD